MRLFFKLLLTLNASSWMFVVYAVKEKWTFFGMPYFLFGLILMMIPILLSILSIWLSRFLGKDFLDEVEEFSLADNEFLPTYLGYFFLSLSVPSDIVTFGFMYMIIFIFTFLSQTQYFNPIFLLLGYHYYHVLTPQGTRIFIIVKGPVLRKKENMVFYGLRRINDTTYINREEK